MEYDRDGVAVLSVVVKFVFVEESFPLEGAPVRYLSAATVSLHGVRVHDCLEGEHELLLVGGEKGSCQIVVLVVIELFFEVVNAKGKKSWVSQKLLFITENM